MGNFVLGDTQGVCTVYGDADTILSAFGRNTYAQVSVMLQSPASLTELNAALKANPTLRVQAKYEAQVIEEGMQRVNGILNFVSYFVGGIMALAATIGAANSLYAIVDGRRAGARDIAGDRVRWGAHRGRDDAGVGGTRAAGCVDRCAGGVGPVQRLFGESAGQ